MKRREVYGIFILHKPPHANLETEKAHRLEAEKVSRVKAERQEAEKPNP